MKFPKTKRQPKKDNIIKKLRGIPLQSVTYLNVFQNSTVQYHPLSAGIPTKVTTPTVCARTATTPRVEPRRRRCVSTKIGTCTLKVSVRIAT
jgi:hypothetical protein